VFRRDIARGTAPGIGRDGGLAELVVVPDRLTVPIGDLDPESVVTPGIYVRRVVEVPAAVKVMDKPGAAA